MSKDCAAHDATTFGRRCVVPLRNLYGVLAQHEVEHPEAGPAREVAEMALEGARVQAEGGVVTAAHFEARAKVLAGTLPSGDGATSSTRASKVAARSVVKHASAAAAGAHVDVAEYKRMIVAGESFVDARLQHLVLMRLVTRVWREQVEERRDQARQQREHEQEARDAHRDGPADQVTTATERRTARREARTQRALLGDFATLQVCAPRHRFCKDMSKVKERPKCLEWDTAKAKRTCNVWGEPAAELPDKDERRRRKREARPTPTPEVRSWRNYESWLWLGTYYRVVSKGVVQAKRREARLRRWRACLISAARERAAASRATGEEPEESSAGSAGGRSRRTRVAVVRFSPNGGTVDATVTRGYTAPRPQAERDCEMLTRRQRRVQVTLGTQTGRRLIEMYEGAAGGRAPGGRSDRRGDG